MATYQTPVSDYTGLDRKAGDAALAAYGELYRPGSSVKLFAGVAAGRSAVALKSEYIKKHGIPARMFTRGTGIAGRQGGTPSRSSRSCGWTDLKHRIAVGGAGRSGGDKQHGRWDLVHQKQRRLDNLGSRLAGLEADMSARRVRLCFGVQEVVADQHL